MNPITSLPIIQRHDLFHCEEGNEQCEKHNHPLRSHILHPNKHMRHKSQQQAHNGVQKPNRKTLSPKLHTGPLIEEYKFVGIVPIRQKQGHFPNYIMHSARNAEEIDKHSTPKPNLGIMKQCLAGQNLLDYKRRPSQEGRHKESQLFLGKHGGPLDGADGELGPGLDEVGHGVGQAGIVPLLHLLRILEALHIGANESDVGERVDPELGETGLGLFELDVAEEKLGGGGRVLVIGDEGGCEEAELVEKALKVEFGLVMELSGVEEDEDRVGPGSFGGREETAEGVIVKVDQAGFGSGLKRQKLGDPVGFSGGEDHGEGDEEEEEEDWFLRDGHRCGLGSSRRRRRLRNRYLTKGVKAQFATEGPPWPKVLSPKSIMGPGA